MHRSRTGGGLVKNCTADAINELSESNIEGLDHASENMHLLANASNRKMA